MKSSPQKTVDQKTIFLVDGLGALLSVVMLGMVLPTFPSYIGMPIPVLYWLAGLAFLLAITSLGCYKFADSTNPSWLRLISTANLAYCALTLCLLVLYYEVMTKLGVFYFVAESLIVIGLALWERKILRRLCITGGKVE